MTVLTEDPLALKLGELLPVPGALPSAYANMLAQPQKQYVFVPKLPWEKGGLFSEAMLKRSVAAKRQRARGSKRSERHCQFLAKYGPVKANTFGVLEHSFRIQHFTPFRNMRPEDCVLRSSRSKKIVINPASTEDRSKYFTSKEDRAIVDWVSRHGGNFDAIMDDETLAQVLRKKTREQIEARWLALHNTKKITQITKVDGKEVIIEGGAVDSDDSEDDAISFVSLGGSEMSNDDMCAVCGDGGDLLCCDTCPQSFHLGCLDLETYPEEEAWVCPDCVESNVDDIIDDTELGEEQKSFLQKKFEKLHDAYGDADGSPRDENGASPEPSAQGNLVGLSSKPKNGRIMAAFLSIIREEDEESERQTRAIEEKEQGGFHYTADRDFATMEAEVFQRFTNIHRVQKTLQTFEEVEQAGGDVGYDDIDDDAVLEHTDEEEEDDDEHVADGVETAVESKGKGKKRKREKNRFISFTESHLKKKRPKYVYVLSLSRFFGAPVLAVESRNVAAVSLAYLDDMFLGTNPLLKEKHGHGRGSEAVNVNVVLPCSKGDSERYFSGGMYTTLKRDLAPWPV